MVKFSKERGEEEVWGGEFGQFLIGAQLGFGRKKGDSLNFLWFIICTFVRLKYSWVEMKKNILFTKIYCYSLYMLLSLS